MEAQDEGEAAMSDGEDPKVGTFELAALRGDVTCECGETIPIAITPWVRAMMPWLPPLISTMQCRTCGRVWEVTYQPPTVIRLALYMERPETTHG